MFSLSSPVFSIISREEPELKVTRIVVFSDGFMDRLDCETSSYSLKEIYELFKEYEDECKETGENITSVEVTLLFDCSQIQ